MEYLFEVKEFDAPNARDLEIYMSGRFYAGEDSIRPIRAKINQAARQFKEFKDRCCCLVLYNPANPFIHLEDWTDVMGAMEGEVAVTWEYDLKNDRPVEGSEKLAFTEGGKMRDCKTGHPQNTTISAILVLRHVNIGARRSYAKFRSLPLGTCLSETDDDLNERRLGVVVLENRNARISLPRDLFDGPFDERYGPDRDQITRIFAGKGIKEYESLA